MMPLQVSLQRPVFDVETLNSANRPSRNTVAGAARAITGRYVVLQSVLRYYKTLDV